MGAIRGTGECCWETNRVGGARGEQEAFPNEEAGIHNRGGGGGVGAVSPPSSFILSLLFPLPGRSMKMSYDSRYALFKW